MGDTAPSSGGGSSGTTLGSGISPAGGSSLAALGLSAYASILKGQGEQSSDEYKAERLERSASVGRVKAEQTGAQMTEGLNQTLGNIDAIRAAAHDDPTSPTGVAVRDLAEYQGNRQKEITVDNILEQTKQDTADAAYMRTAGKWALLGGELNAATGVLSGISKMGMPGGGG